MWVPTTESEIQSAIDNGVLKETSSFDAKEALPSPGKNKELAKDICAMTVDGGVLLYGVGGADRSRPDTLMPFDRAGAAERIDQVAQTSIHEPPVIEIGDIDSENEPGKGYLAVVIRASPRAPHMLTIDKDGRYYGRGATGNRQLNEAEVARLYERRERWEADRGEILDNIVREIPFELDPAEVAPMCMFARPVAPMPDLLDRAVGDCNTDAFLREQLLRKANEVTLYRGQGFMDVSAAISLRRQGSEVWVLDAEREPTFDYQARIEIRRDGRLIFWQSPAAINPENRGRFLLERSVTRNVLQFLTVAGWFYSMAGYVGAVDVGLAVLNLEDVRASTLARTFEPGPVFGAPDYRHTERVTMLELVGDTEQVVLRLVNPLFDVISIRAYDPLKDEG